MIIIASIIITVIVFVVTLTHTSTIVVYAQEEQLPFSAERVFRETVDVWQVRTNNRKVPDDPPPWFIWTDYASQLFTVFDDIIVSSTQQQPTNEEQQLTKKRRRKKKNRNTTSRLLEVIGGCEEGILFIEKLIYEQNLGSDDNRDAALSRLYTTYGSMLSKLQPSDCFRLASDPHTLLVGAPETLEKFHDIPGTETAQGQEEQQQQQESRNDDVSTRVEKIFGPLCLENADNALRNAVALDARNVEATELLEALSGLSKEDVHSRKGQEFVALLFDEVAQDFDKKLLVDLHYQVPVIIGSTIRSKIVEDQQQRLRQGERQPSDSPSSPSSSSSSSSATSFMFSAALDAGAGTGLAGRQIRSYVDGPMIAVDASQKMLDVARKCTYSKGCESSSGSGANEPTSNIDSEEIESDNRPLYESLLKMDLEDMTVENTIGTLDVPAKIDGFDLIVAADVLVYFGNLERIVEVFSNLSSLTRPSYLVFTCERATNDEAPLGYRLLPTGRFAHTKKHALDTATNAGFELLYYDEIIPRMEREEPVQGHLFVFVRRPEATTGEEL